jgi:hypothetical protein
VKGDPYVECGKSVTLRKGRREVQNKEVRVFGMIKKGIFVVETKRRPMLDEA